MTDNKGGTIDATDRDLLAAMAFCWADLLMEIDENGYILFVAGATESLLGCLPDRLIGEALEKIVIRSERPLLRAYLHAGPGIKRLEELDLDFQLPDDDPQENPPVPLSLSGYMVAEPVTRYFLAARHRAIRPRARSGIDRLILQNNLAPVGKSPARAVATPADHARSAQNGALVVLENLAALRSQAETDATNELARLIGIGRRDDGPIGNDNGLRQIDEPMIELERRIVAYATALRSDLDEPRPAPPPDPTHPANGPSRRDMPDMDHGHDDKPRSGNAKDSNCDTPPRHDGDGPSPSAPLFGNDDPFGDDYEVARNIHHRDDPTTRAIRAGMKEANLTRAVAYALSRRQHGPDSEVSAERLSASLPHLIQETLKSVRAFREIVHSGSFSVALQPIVELQSRDMHHFEALARFQDGSGTLAVDQIIHFAEGTGLITEFDLAMCRKVMEHLVRDPGRISHPVAVNLSGHSLEQPDFVTSLEGILDSFGPISRQIMFEVTETSRIRALREVNASLQRLRARGHLVCLDDFGAGAANFEYLSALDVDIIKFDGGAMRTALANPKGRAFIRATALLCRELGIHTIAEMIYDQASYELVRDLGIDFGQGYYVGAPVTLTPPGTYHAPSAYQDQDSATGPDRS